MFLSFSRSPGAVMGDALYAVTQHLHLIGEPTDREAIIDEGLYAFHTMKVVDAPTRAVVDMLFHGPQGEVDIRLTQLAGWVFDNLARTARIRTDDLRPGYFAPANTTLPAVV